MKNLRIQGALLLAVLAVVGYVVYSPLYGVGFVTDFLGWIDCEQGTPLLQSHLCFQNRGLYYVPFILLSLLTELFAFHPLPWFLVFVGFHVLNAYLVARLTNVLYDLFGLPRSHWIPVVAAFLFLLFPYQVEVVAWKACINYLTSCTLMLFVVINYINWLNNGHRRSLWWAIGLFAISMFDLEFALLVPVLLVGLHLVSPAKHNNSVKGLRTAFRGILLFLGVIILFLLINRIIIGKAVGHYVVELSAFNPLTLASAELKYAFKVLCFGRLWPYPMQDGIYSAISSPVVGGLVLIIVAAFTVYILVTKKRLSGMFLIRSFLLFGAMLFILPIAHLYFYYLQYSENDRYTYFAMIFISIGIPAIFFSLGRIGRIILAAYLIIALWGTLKLNNLWHQSYNIHERLVESFRWNEHSEVYILNLPDNLRGVFMFRNIGGDSAFEEVLTLLNGQTFNGKMYDIFQYNMATSTDGVSVIPLDDAQYEVTFNQWGNWWWRNGIGGTNYETDKYTAKVNGQSYTVQFKNIARDAAIIYFDGTLWRDVSQRN